MMPVSTVPKYGPETSGIRTPMVLSCPTAAPSDTAHMARPRHAWSLPAIGASARLHEARTRPGGAYHPAPAGRDVRPGVRPTGELRVVDSGREPATGVRVERRLRGGPCRR